MTVRIRFGRDYGELEVGPGTSLLAAASRAKAPLGNACRGQGVCRACAVQVISGTGLLEAPSLACQTRVHPADGLVELWTPHWGVHDEWLDDDSL